MSTTTKHRIRKTNTMKLIEIKNGGVDICELLKQAYLDKRMGIEDIAKQWEVSPCTVHKYLVQFDIARRKLTFI